MPAETSRPRKGRRIATVLPPVERAAAARVAAALSERARFGRSIVEVIGDNGHRLVIPDALANVIEQAAKLLADGRGVSVQANEEMLTTQAAADRLNVSRQYVVRLVDQGAIPSQKVGSHRRLRASDVECFRVDRDRQRNTALDRLAALSEDAGGYDRSDTD